jgi:hypothetical protein
MKTDDDVYLNLPMLDHVVFGEGSILTSDNTSQIMRGTLYAESPVLVIPVMTSSHF